MKSHISIEEARLLLRKHITDDYTLKHSRESEVIMKALANHFNMDEELWAVAGLLHDLDWQETENNIEKHGLRTVEILQNEGYDIPELFRAIKAHCESIGTGVRETKIDYALSAAENITGIIIAYVLMRPDKKLALVETSSITKKFKDRSFAAKVDRGVINDIEKIGLSRADFIALALDAMKSIADEIGF
ncbi:MAG: HDIG domain-containing metalloprotein [Candidatus Aenigmatarchaeota archaeon]